MFSPIHEKLKIEYRSLSCWNVPAFIAGILFILNNGPISWWILGIILGICLAFSYLKKIIRPVLNILLFFCIGAGVMSYRIGSLHTPTLSYPLYDVEITGSISEINVNPDKQTLILKNVNFLNQPTQKSLSKAKLIYPHTTPRLSVGETVHLRVVLRPPQTPITPDGYDESKMFFFQGIGAGGTIREIISHKYQSQNWRGYLENYRRDIANRIYQIMPREAAQVAVPLTIGDQSVVSQHLYHIFRGAGITHILSVSGFHLSLLAVFVFFLIRTLLACIPAVSERFNTRKIAAGIALIGCVGYILISGMQVPAIRSLLMITLVMIACIIDRNALSVRSLSLAAFIMLLFRPELILNIGFQLSFTAVLILLTLYDPLRNWILPKQSLSFFNRFLRFLIGFILADFIMMIALAPLITYHFHQYAPYGFLGNILTGIILSFWIMPLLFIALITLPLGGDILFLKGAAIGIEYIISICEKIYHFPLAIVSIPSFSGISLTVMMLGIVILCLMRTRLKIIGISVIIAGIFMAYFSPKPDLLIGDKGQTIAVCQDGQLKFLRLSENNYTATQWLRNNGEKKDPVLHGQSGLPCLLSLKGKRVAFCFEECAKADICFLPVDKTNNERSYPLFGTNGYAVYIKNNAIKVQKSRPFIPAYFDGQPNEKRSP